MHTQNMCTVCEICVLCSRRVCVYSERRSPISIAHFNCERASFMTRSRLHCDICKLKSPQKPQYTVVHKSQANIPQTFTMHMYECVVSGMLIYYVQYMRTIKLHIVYFIYIANLVKIRASPVFFTKSSHGWFCRETRIQILLKIKTSARKISIIWMCNLQCLWNDLNRNS